MALDVVTIAYIKIILYANQLYSYVEPLQLEHINPTEIKCEIIFEQNNDPELSIERINLRKASTIMINIELENGV